MRLDLYVKNIETLLVKVYELNTLNYYRENLREIETTLNLDGLAPGSEKTYEYNEPPLLRVMRSFSFPEMKGRGAWVVEFIGDGKSSRALILKGRLRYVERPSTAGQVLAVLDEENKHVKDASIYLGGHQYLADEEGLITLPFSTKAARKPHCATPGRFR